MKIKSLLRPLLLTAFIFSMIAPCTFAAQKGEKTFGIRTGYVSRNRSADLGLFFQYTFSENFRLQPAADLVFRHDDRDAFLVDLNAQFPIGVNTETFCLYPLAGLNFSSWNRHSKIWVPADEALGSIMQQEINKRTNRFGVNVGAGFDLNISESLKINLEAEYTFIKSNSGVRILAGIGYIF